MQTIKTARLLLRNFVLEDMQDLYEYARQDDVGPNAGWKPHGCLQETQEILLHFIYAEECWAIEEKQTGKVIGSIGLRADRRRNYKEAKNIGYVLNHDYWGQGYMPEALQAVLQYGFEQEDLLIISVEHYPFNLRSKRVIEKCGFKLEGVLRKAFAIYNGEIYDHVCYSITKEEYMEKTLAE